MSAQELIVSLFYSRTETLIFQRVLAYIPIGNIQIVRMVNEAARNGFWTWNIKLVREIERGRFWIDCNWFPDLVHIIRNYILLKESERVILHWLNWTLNDHLQHKLKNVNWWNKKCFIGGYNDDRCNYLLYLSSLYAEKNIWIIILTCTIQMVKYILIIHFIKIRLFLWSFLKWSCTL